MKKIIYHVAVSLDGYIANTDGSVEGFSHDEQVVNDYQESLQNYSTAIMGRNTYEFAYQYGLQPGSNPYPHMDTYVFSNQLAPSKCDSNFYWTQKDPLKTINEIKNNASGPIYLCGGGKFAGYLYSHGLIDEIILKLNPITLGNGISLLEGHHRLTEWVLFEKKIYDCGVLLLHYILK